MVRKEMSRRGGEQEEAEEGEWEWEDEEKERTVDEEAGYGG